MGGVKIDELEDMLRIDIVDMFVGFYVFIYFRFYLFFFKFVCFFVFFWFDEEMLK